MDALLAARMQMALTLGFHIVLACLGVGLPLLLLFAEWRHIRTGDPQWKHLARRWSKSFAVLFAVGAVSGTVLSFELGLLWPGFMGKWGSVIGLPFTLEAFAFFLEAIFLGIYLYGWDRLPTRIHFLTGIPVAVSGLLSAFFVVTANAWMNSPQGFTLEDGKVVDVDPFAAMFNPATWAQCLHMIVAAYMVAGFCLAAVYAKRRLRGHNDTYHKRAMMVPLLFACAFAPLQALIGDYAGKVVAQTQPVKFAAMEDHWVTQKNAPIHIGPIEIPGMLSWMAFGDSEAEVLGLNDVPEGDRPPVRIVRLSFLVMVGAGVAMLGLAVWCAWALIRRKSLPESRVFLWSVRIAGPLSIIALECGWIVTEVGRQPWIVHGQMRTAEAVTRAPGIGWILLGTLVVYGILAYGTYVILRRLSRES